MNDRSCQCLLIVERQIKSKLYRYSEIKLLRCFKAKFK